MKWRIRKNMSIHKEVNVVKIVNYRVGNRVRIACQEGEQIIDLNGAYLSLLRKEGKIRAEQIAEAFIPADSVGFYQGGEESIELAKKAVDYMLTEASEEEKQAWVFQRSDVKIEAPVINPGKIICVGHNYRDHIQEMGREIPKYPVLFAKFANAIIGPEDDIPLFPNVEKLDYEAEFAFVVGKRARNVKEEDALDYVAGYTIVNDVSARDLQFRTLEWLQGKANDGSAPMGPWLVTKDEIPDPDALEMSLRVNGEERQRANTKNLVFNVNRMLSYVSEIMTLEPGDVILTGTPGGVGHARDPQTYLQDGDVVDIEISGIGKLENTVRKTDF